MTEPGRVAICDIVSVCREGPHGSYADARKHLLLEILVFDYIQDYLPIAGDQKMYNPTAFDNLIRKLHFQPDFRTFTSGASPIRILNMFLNRRKTPLKRRYTYQC